MESLSEVPADVRGHWNALREWVDQYFAASTQFFQSIDLYTFVVSIVERVKGRLPGRSLDIRVDGANDLFISMDPQVLRDVAEGHQERHREHAGRRHHKNRPRAKR
jgi:hypothetical protein